MTKHTLEDTLAQRKTIHGDWADNARISKELRDVVRYYMHQEKMAPACEEALNAIIGKIARILAGDPHFVDHWHDIAGYATLAENWLMGNADVPIYNPQGKEQFNPKITSDSEQFIPSPLADPNTGIPGIDTLTANPSPRKLNPLS